MCICLVNVDLYPTIVSLVICVQYNNIISNNVRGINHFEFGGDPCAFVPYMQILGLIILYCQDIL